MIRFIFDLDGTITSQETLPLIAKYFHISKDIKKLTDQTVKGNIPFIESFIKRVNILGKLPINEIRTLLEKTKLHPEIIKFISEHRQNCIIATGNLDCWVDKLLKKIPCKHYTSKAIIKNNKVIKIAKIIKKGKIVDFYKKQGDKIVFIGEGNNDIEAMRKADISIASGLTHYPAPSVLTVANYLIFSEKALCRQLNQLL